MKPIWTCVLVLGVLAGLASAGDTPDAKLVELEQKLIDLTNQERKKRDLPPLKASPQLLKIARSHSDNMAQQGKMEHNLDGKTPFDRMRSAGYRFAKGGENIAACDAVVPPATLMKAWMDSKNHRENILLAEFSEIGLGLSRDKTGQIYYPQLFARPKADE